MKYFGPRQVRVGVLAAFATLVAGLLSEPAQAADLMFRMEEKYYGAAGTVSVGVSPATTEPACGAAGADCIGAAVGTTAPAAKFALPKSFRNTYYFYTYTGYTGYTSTSVISSYNGVGNFEPNNPNGVAPSLPASPTPTYGRAFFPTTGGNKAPNKGQGNPVVPTTTFSGDFDFSRAGSMKVTPGPNRFGGTMRFLGGPNASFYQFITFNSPYISKAYGEFVCRHAGGAACTTQEPSLVGQITSSGMVTRFQLTAAGINKATTGGGAYISSIAHYLNINNPWTTGKAYAQNPLNQKNQKFTATGYDKAFSPPTSKTIMYSTETTSGASTATTKTLKGITRITSMVRPRLRHAYLRPSDPNKPLETNWQAARIWALRVFFLPEPSALVLLGSGTSVLAGLAFLRRR